MSNRIREEFLQAKESVRLNKYLSEAGVCSRREADRLIESGKVTVDGVTAQMGMRVTAGQIVKVGKKTVSKQDEMIVLAVNKPKGIVCTEDQRERDSIVRFLNYPVRVTYAGRLDKDSRGLLLMTNNGDIINQMMRAANRHEKEYKVTVDKEKIAECDSVGGVVECVISGLPVGLGEPVFEKLDANLAKAILSIGAVKGFEIGDGFAATKACGSENNDEFRMDGDKILKETNHAGGVLGGISDGSDVIFRAAFKPTPSIAKSQETVTKDGENIDLVIHGRHYCI